MRIAAYQSKALFKGWCRSSYNFNFILLKGHLTVYKKHSGVSKAEQCQIVWTMLDAAFFPQQSVSGSRHLLEIWCRAVTVFLYYAVIPTVSFYNLANVFKICEKSVAEFQIMLN